MNYKDNNWKEVPLEEAEYAVILRAGSSETGVYFYATKEDLEWALGNSWFNYSESTPVKLLKKEITINTQE